MDGLKVWTYWEGPMPAYIEVCLESIRRFCKDFTLLTPDNAHDYVGELIPPKWNALPRPSDRADVIRVATISKYGGLWTDADTAFIRPVNLLLERYNGDFLYSRWNNGRALNGYFYGTKDHPLLQDWLERIQVEVDANVNQGSEKKLEWMQLGEHLLTPLIASGKYDQFNLREIPRSIFLPVNIERDRASEVFFEEVSYKNFITANTIAVGLNHSYFRDWHMEFVNKPREQLFDNTLIGRALRDSQVGYTQAAYDIALGILVFDQALWPGDLQVLVDFMRGMDYVAEIGTYCGKTAKILSCLNNRVFTVDLFEKVELIENDASRDEYRELYARFPHHFDNVKAFLAERPNVEVVQGLSHLAAARILDNVLDGLFVDGDHSYNGITKDWKAWFPKMKIGGLILIHDVNHWHPGLLKFFDEVTKTGTVQEIRSLPTEDYTSMRILKKIK